MENEIVDLILPQPFNKELALRELDFKYSSIYTKFDSHVIQLGALRHKDFARNYVKELDEIENRHTKYDEYFWYEVEKLNRNKLNKFQINFHIHPNIEKLWFGFANNSSINYKFDEIELINEHYRLLQKIYYSRLEAENGK